MWYFSQVWCLEGLRPNLPLHQTIYIMNQSKQKGLAAFAEQALAAAALHHLGGDGTGTGEGGGEGTPTPDPPPSGGPTPPPTAA